MSKRPMLIEITGNAGIPLSYEQTETLIGRLVAEALPAFDGDKAAAESAVIERLKGQLGADADKPDAVRGPQGGLILTNPAFP